MSAQKTDFLGNSRIRDDFSQKSALRSKQNSMKLNAMVNFAPETTEGVPRPPRLG